MWRHSDRRERFYFVDEVLLRQHPVTLLRLHSYPHQFISLPLTRNFINNVFIFQAPPPPTCSHAAAKYPQKIIAMRRYWIIIIAIPFNSFQLWSYNSIFGIRAKWVTTTSWNCFFFFFLAHSEKCRAISCQSYTRFQYTHPFYAHHRHLCRIEQKKIFISRNIEIYSFSIRKLSSIK